MTWTEAAALWEALDGFAWPVVVAGAVLGFRDSLRGLIERVRTLKGAGIEVQAGAFEDKARRANTTIQEAQKQIGQDVEAPAPPTPESREGPDSGSPAERIRAAWGEIEEELRGLAVEALGIAEGYTTFDVTDSLDLVLARLGAIVPFEVSLSLVNLGNLYRSVRNESATVTPTAAGEFELAAWRARSFLNFIRRKKLYDPPHGGLTVT
jgi:hypothetical protein